MKMIGGLIPLLTAVVFITSSLALDLNTNDIASVRAAAGNLVKSLLASYPPANGVFPQLASYYWWEAGAFWGALVDYSSYTGDHTYVGETMSALTSQAGQSYDYVPAAQVSSEANDDQAFWIFSVLDALEQGFPALPCVGAAGECANGYFKMADNAFNEFVSRYNADSGVCGGGLRWQYTPTANGYDYKNTVSNGGFFNVAARLARYTGQKHYADWAEKIWAWEESVDLISKQYEVFDGVHVEDGCKTPNKQQWTYNNAIHMHGAAMMYNYTGGTTKWQKRVQGLLNHGKRTFFTPFRNATDIMYEPSCELSLACDIDNTSFKAYLARFWAKTSVLVPFTASTIRPLLVASAQGAAKSCTGSVCGMAWWYGGYDGTSGLGQDLSALETVQSLLANRAPPPHRNKYFIPKPVSSAAAREATSTSQRLSTRATSSTKTISKRASSSTSRTSSTKSSSSSKVAAVSVSSTSAGDVGGTRTTSLPSATIESGLPASLMPQTMQASSAKRRRKVLWMSI